MTLCFIPARGGSQRIPRKNLIPLAGRPLLAYTLDTAGASGVFDQVVVSSDDDDIRALATAAGVLADRRPPHLAGDRVRFVEVLDEFLWRNGAPAFDQVAVLLPTCPFRTVEDIRAAFELRAGSPEAFIVSVSEYEFSPSFACDLAPDGRALRVRHPEVYARSTQSQSVAPAYHPNGAIFIAPVARLRKTQSFFIDPVLAYVMPRERACDIDYPHQIPVAEALLRATK
jgi:CMP-N-acetylneuraminic acid synthetase